MCPIRLYDSLSLAIRDEGDVFLQTRSSLPRNLAGVTNVDRTPVSQLPSNPEKNLVVKAVRLFQAASGITQGVDLELVKRIPISSGLGGGSSDAATTLLGCNVLFGQPLTFDELLPLAAQLGSDVPFFMYASRPGPSFGCAAICRGRGEIVEPLRCQVPLPLSIVRPQIGLATGQVYQVASELLRGQLKDIEPSTPSCSVGEFADALTRGEVSRLPSLIYNRLEEAAFCVAPSLRELQTTVRRYSRGTLLCGSGSAIFSIHTSIRESRRMARKALGGNVALAFAVQTG